MTIALEVASEIATQFLAKTPEEQQKLQFLLEMRLHQLISPPTRTLDQVMDDMGAYATARGMTPQLLESILNEK